MYRLGRPDHLRRRQVGILWFAGNGHKHICVGVRQMVVIQKCSTKCTVLNWHFLLVML